MRKLFVSMCLLMATASAWAGRIVTDSIQSNVLGASVKYNIYLPSGFERDSRQYPVVFLLHGLTDTYRAWDTKGGMREITDELIQAEEAVPMVIVMPVSWFWANVLLPLL